MFGNTGFGNTGAFGQQQQQQQPNNVFGQQPQQQSAFGGGAFGATSQPSAFGQTAATTNAFGQPQQQSAFGSTPTTGAFGSTNTAFGQNRPAFGSTSTPAFGATQPTTSTGFGGGGFGSNTTTSAFGSTNNQATGGLFGQRPATNAFGSTTTTGAFGQPAQQNTAFGGGGLNTSTSAFGQPAGGVNQGTAVADFAPTQDRDITTGVNNFFQTITAMPQYKNYSLEELRLQDYQQNRKTAGAAGGGAFGATNTAGAFGSNTTTGGAFGQPANTGAFGSTTTSAFGQPAATGFGANTNTTGGGLFGQQQNNTTSAFGQPAATGAFGSTTNAFGQNNNQATGAFGATNTNAFGAAASKPFSFGNTAAPAATGFGQTNTTPFGQQNNATAGAFGQQNNTATNTFGFGQKPATTGTTGFGGFGNTATNTGAFGGNTGAFGAAASKPATNFSFGAAAPTTNTNTFGFGNTATPAAGAFGQTNTSTGGLFGAAKPAAPTTSLFGNTAGATGTTGGFGGFGANTTGATGTTGGFGGFGANNTGATNTTFGGFGQKPATGTTGFGGFGGNTFGQQNQTGGTFNLPATGGLTSFGTNPLQQQPLVAGVDKNPYGNNPLFDLSKVSSNANNNKLGPAAVALDGSRKTNNPHYPISPRVVSKIKLRGFSFTPSVKSSLKKHTTTSTLDGISDDAVLGAGAFAPRPNNKKLVMDDNVDTAKIVSLINNKPVETRKAVFDPQLEYIAATERGATTTVTTTTTTTTTTTSSESIRQEAVPVVVRDSGAKNGYYISPTLETLAGMPKEGLKQVQNLVVGRKGYGEVRFNQPVDLSEVSLDDIFKIVVIEERKVVIYPEQGKKPAKGTQLNVPATITLENCFPVDKNTGAPIKDPSHPRFKRFKEKLSERANLEFVSYDEKTGDWVFKVSEF